MRNSNNTNLAHCKKKKSKTKLQESRCSNRNNSRLQLATNKILKENQKLNKNFQDHRECDIFYKVFGIPFFFFFDTTATTAVFWKKDHKTSK